MLSKQIVSMNETHSVKRQRQARERQEQKHRFQCTLRFYETIQSDECRQKVSFTTGPKSLYENLYRLEPKQFISRPHFLTAMRLVYHFNPTNKGHNVMLDRLYFSYDTFRCNKMIWRQLLTLLYIIHNPLMTTGDVLRWSFSVCSSADIFDSSFQSEASLSFGAIKNLFNPLLEIDKINCVYDLCDDIWIKTEMNKVGYALLNVARLDDMTVNKQQFEDFLLNKEFGDINKQYPIANSESFLVLRFGHMNKFEER